MQNLKKVKLGDLVERITSGGTPSTSVKEYYGGEIPWLKTQEVNFNRIYKTETFITHEGLKNSSAKLIKENSVIIAMYGNTAAKVAINKIPLSTNQACCNITVDPLKADYRYIYYYFLKEYESLKSLANGGAQQNLNAAIIRNYEIELPELSIQSRIASILSSLDDKIELNRRTNQTLEQIAQTLFKKYFLDDIDPENLPDGWTLGILGDVSKNIKITLSPNELLSGEKYIGLEHMPRKSLSIYEWGDSAGLESNKFAFKENHILFGKLRPYFHKVIFAPFDGVCSTDILVIEPMEIFQFPFCLFHCYSNELVNYSNLFSGGTRMPRTSWEVIREFEIAIPPKNLFVEFNGIILPILKRIQQTIIENEVLNNVRDLLLPKLICGEIELN